MAELLVESIRGPLVEVRHRGAIAVVDATGRLLLAAGDPGLVTYWRSAAKPFQAMPLHYTGTLDRFGFEPADLALFCASHSGTPEHVARVTAALARAGLAPELLQCGAHLPYDAEAAAALQRAGQAPTSLHSNCSGKHTGMLALARHLGYEADGYLEPAHPIQQVIMENICLMTGLTESEIATGVDGCGVPCYGLPLTAMALAFARLADPDAIPADSGRAALPPGFQPPAAAERRAAARRVRDAMMAHPEMVGGRARLDTDLMRAAGGVLVAKSGAAGVYCMGILPAAGSGVPGGAHGGVGVAVKMEDGDPLGSARNAAALECLAQLGLLTAELAGALAGYRRPPVRNVAGRVVGETRAVFQLRSVD